MGRVPKYEWIRKDLIKQIQNGIYAPGTELPSETELIEKYNVSRITIRHALNELYIKDYIEKKQGKRACVKRHPRIQTLDDVSSYTEQIQQQGMQPSREVISSGLRLCMDEVIDLLHLDKTDPVYFLERVIYADAVPLCYTYAILPYRYFRDIESFDFAANSLYDVLEHDYGVKITSSSVKIKAVAAEEEIADHLQVKKDFPLLYYCGITYGIVNGKEEPIEYFINYSSTELFEYSITQTRN